MSEMKELLQKTREYLDYIEEHYNNVQKAWELVQEKCKDMKFITDDFEWAILNQDILNHDKSKLSEKEFTQYRRKFFPTDEEKLLSENYPSFKSEVKYGFDMAWEHHQELNDHHWQTWTTKDYGYPRMEVLHCVHMLVDWIAMSMKFGDTAIDYYQKNKDGMAFPEWAARFIMEVLNKVYDKEV